MYKIITHTIREEHYDHPATAEYALTGQGTNMGNAMPKISQVTRSDAFNSPASIAFTQAVRTVFEQYVGTLRNYIVSASGTGEEMPILEEKLYTVSKGLENVVKEYYGDAAGVAFAEKFRAYTVGLLELIKAEKSGSAKAVTDAEANLKNKIGEIAAFLNMANAAWPQATVIEYLDKFHVAEHEQTKARKDKRWADDQTAADTAHNLFVSGAKTMPAFADVVAKGVIMQYPARFR